MSLSLSSLALVVGSISAHAHERSHLGGHLASTGGGGVNTAGFRSFLSGNLMWVDGTGSQGYSGYGLTAMVGDGPQRVYVSPEYVSGWSSMFASTGVAVGPVARFGEDLAGGAQISLFADVLVYGDVRVAALYGDRVEALFLFSVGVGTVGSHTSFNQ